MSLLGGANSMGPTGTVGNATDPGAGAAWAQAPGIGTTTMPPLDKPTASGSPLINRPVVASEAPPNLTLGTDPAYLAYLRSTGLGESQAKAAAQANADAVNRSLQVAIPQYQQTMQDRIQNMDNSYDARGVFRSGYRLMRDAQIQRDVQGQIEAARAAAAEKIAGINTTESNAIAKYQMDMANQTSAAQSRIAQANAYNQALAQWYAQNPGAPPPQYMT